MQGRHPFAIVIPCHNEALTIDSVVRRFRALAPSAIIVVCDNASSDDTADRARRAGAIVLSEPRKGKGRAVKTLIERVVADAYLLVDGDDTYSADEFTRVASPILRGELDMCVGSRMHPASETEFRLLNRLGNRIFSALARWVLGLPVTDMLSGYRAFTREFALGLGEWSDGFEIETDFTVGAARLGARFGEVPVGLRPRPAGSYSKLSLIGDGLRILRRILSAMLPRSPGGRQLAIGSPAQPAVRA